MLYLNKLQIDEIQQSRRLITAQYEDDIKKNRGSRSESTNNRGQKKGNFG